MFDTGLLKHMAGIDNSAILLKSEYQFKGPFAENFVLQYGTEIIPVEAKGGEDKTAPSFKRYVTEHQPEYAVRFSKCGYRKDGYITNIPLCLARKTKEIL